MTAAAAPLRVAVVGTGRIGAMHAELLAHDVPGAALAAVHDPDRASAARVGAQLGVDAVADVDALLARDDVDAVAICSSTDTHADLMVVAAEAGKPIFVEKPVSLDLAEIDRALAAVERAGVPLQVGFNRRFDPRTRPCTRRSRRAPSGRRTSCASRAATRTRRRWSTRGAPVASSST